LSDITADILALSFDSPSSPSIQLKLPEQIQSSHPLGWGVAWYPNDHQAAIVSKDPAARGLEAQLDALSDWDNFRSTVYFCKAQGAARGYTHHETQPFSRSFAGQDWIFLHNGDLDKTKLRELHKDTSRFLEPLGTTDSELAFCYLLGRMKETEGRKLSDVPYETLLGWFQQLDPLGSADICISDGSTTACFRGTGSVRKLFYSEIAPPAPERVFNSTAALLYLGDPRDTHRTMLAVTSCRFDTGNWIAMQPGQLLVIRRGAIVWDSHPSGDRILEPRPVQLALPIKAEQVFSRTQTDQAQAQTHQSIVNIRSMTHTPDGRKLTYRTYDVLHATEYAYSAPVEQSTHTFRLQPVEDQTQEVVNALVSISVDGEEIGFEDVFGNQSIHYSIHKPYTQLSIVCQSRVKVFASPPDDHSLSRRQANIPLVWMPWARQMMTPYLLPEELPETQLRELTDYAMSFVQRNDFHLMETLKDMNLSIYKHYKYVSDSTSLSTTPFEVYADRQGVCQDFANLLICMARLLSIPARYRMGYIYTGGNYENQIQSDASHAWVEIYLPYVGWRGFDPTNGCMVSQDHVRVACGRNYRDATPTSGTIFKGGGAETLKVQVKLQELTN
jgi:transglutaminase-like putative cysteine protease/predicted glutamine amidotransferase